MDCRFAAVRKADRPARERRGARKIGNRYSSAADSTSSSQCVYSRFFLILTCLEFHGENSRYCRNTSMLRCVETAPPKLAVNRKSEALPNRAAHLSCSRYLEVSGKRQHHARSARMMRFRHLAPRSKTLRSAAAPSCGGPHKRFPELHQNQRFRGAISEMLLQRTMKK